MKDNTMKHLPGNPFDPRHAYNRSDIITGESEERWVSEDGQTEAVLIALNLKQNAFATMALAFEQRTANLIALLPQMSQIEMRAELVDQITARLNLDSEVQS